MIGNQQPTGLLLSQAWATLLERTAELILLLDPADRVTAASAAARALFGAGAALLGQPVRALLGLAPEAPLAGSHVLPDGRSASLCLNPLHDVAGRLLGALLLLPTRSNLAEAGDHLDPRERQLREVTLTISSALEIDAILDRVVRLSIELIGADAGSLPLYDLERDNLIPRHLVGISGQLQLPPIRRDTGVVWELIDTGKPLLINDYPAHPRAIPALLAQGVRAVVAVPVRAGNKTLGVLNLYSRTPGRRFSHRGLQLLETVARQAGVALENARLYQAALRDAERRAIIYRASLEFGAALAPAELYQAIHQATTRLMPCDTCAIALLDEERAEIEYVYLVDGAGSWPSERVPVTRGLLGFICRTGISLRITGCDPELEGWFGAEPFGEGEQPTGSLLAVALQVGGRAIGALSVQAMASNAYTTDDLDVLEMFAATAAITLQNALLFARVQQLATLDPLTGVANRRHFYELSRQELERAARYGHSLSLLMIDVDHFKQINDTHGHGAGDQVLQVLAQRFKHGLRENDLVGRYGGEEFLVLLPETAGDRALQVAERLCELARSEPVATDEGPVAVSISIGIVSCACGRASTIEPLIDHADRALYVAKRSGRNQIRIATSVGPVQAP